MNAISHQKTLSVSTAKPASIIAVREKHLVEPTNEPIARTIQFDKCIGWFHMPAQNPSTTAVVICPGLRADGVTGYRSFRMMGTALAAAGYPTLRFDYPGTGDSGEPDESDLWAEWLKSIDRAAEWLRQNANAERIVLVGLRVGATLATLAAEQRPDIAGLVLIAPVMRGRTYIRELITEVTVRGGKPRAGDQLQTDDFDLSAEAVQRINGVNLADTRAAPGSQIIVYAPSPSPALSNCVAKWTADGASVTCEDFTGLDPFLRPGFMAHEPSADVSRVVDWIRSSIPSTSCENPITVPTGPVTLRHDGCIEEPFRFGDRGHLFGVLCRPTDHVAADKIVVIVNPSGDPHHGVARLNVVLARALAAQGFPSLRIDFAGLGDSIAPGDVETHIFETDRNPDVSAAIDALSKIGFHQFAIQGLCSGAYHAFRAAVADERIGDLITVNLPLFRWRTGDSVEFLSYVGASPLAQLPKLASLRSLKRLLRSDPLALYSRIAMQSTWFSGMLKAVTRFSTRLFGSGLAFTFAQKSMRDLGKRCRSLLLFADGDQGMVNFEKEFSIRRPPSGASVITIPGMDHSLTNQDMRRVVIGHMVRFLRGSDPA
jgi:pimeloyl-ACP methyl ester carboxylesterase